MYKAFVSSRQQETAELRAVASTPFIQNGIQPFIFEWTQNYGDEIINYIEKEIKQHDLFVGIYDKEYGEATIPDTDDKGTLISPIEFEMKLAYKHLDKENVFLFMRSGVEQHPKLKEMIGKISCIPFQSTVEFKLRLDQLIKDWKISKAQLIKPEAIHEHLMSVETDTYDRPGILAAVFNAINTLKGNIIRAKQNTYLGSANIKILIEWTPEVEFPSEQKVYTLVSEELGTIYPGKSLDKNEIKVKKISNREGEVRTKGIYKVTFWDGPGIAKRIFSVFYQQNISILESRLEMLTVQPPVIAQFLIIANISSMAIDHVKTIPQGLKAMGGIIHVDESMEFGSWLY